MQIFKGVKTVDGRRAVYFEELDLVAISDLQLGEETYLAEEAKLYLPQVQLSIILEEIRFIKDVTKAKRILINGDLKHEFKTATYQEWNEVKKLSEELKKLFSEIIVIRGNHDNFLLTISNKIGLNVIEEHREKGYLFLHGHRLPDDYNGVQTVVIGHEQPAVVLKSGYDRVKVHVILYGKDKLGHKFICLPAFSPIASGVEVNITPKEELLSPFFHSTVDIDELKAIAVDPSAGAFRLPKVKLLRSFLTENA
ncbi:MAG: metallophosphoesterase [Nitrososphaeria archaeon]|jgi:putative SbcD/Mre11-related phosphoesterase